MTLRNVQYSTNHISKHIPFKASATRKREIVIHFLNLNEFLSFPTQNKLAEKASINNNLKKTHKPNEQMQDTEWLQERNSDWILEIFPRETVDSTHGGNKVITKR